MTGCASVFLVKWSYSLFCIPLTAANKRHILVEMGTLLMLKLNRKVSISMKKLTYGNVQRVYRWIEKCLVHTALRVKTMSSRNWVKLNDVWEVVMLVDRASNFFFFCNTVLSYGIKWKKIHKYRSFQFEV